MKIPTVKDLRKALTLSQREMADLLGVSLKAIQSYEQGWRGVPPHIEQMVLLHTILHRGLRRRKAQRCWEVHDCAPSVWKKCPAYQVRQPGFCWLVTGTLCHGERMNGWEAKRDRCLKCKVLKGLLTRR